MSESEKQYPRLSTFREAGFISKKQWILPDWLIRIFKWISPLIVIGVMIPIILTIKKMKRPYLWPKVIIIFILSLFFGDLMSSIAHVTFVDNAYSDAVFRTDEDDYMIVPVLYGYSSGHHYFPSNWKDIDDSTSWLTLTFLTLFFTFFAVILIDNKAIRLLILFTYFMVALAPISHKYMHERHHNRPVPVWVDCIY